MACPDVLLERDGNKSAVFLKEGHSLASSDQEGLWRKRGSDKNTLGADDTEKGGTECGGG